MRFGLLYLSRTWSACIKSSFGSNKYTSCNHCFFSAVSTVGTPLWNVVVLSILFKAVSSLLWRSICEFNWAQTFPLWDGLQCAFGIFQAQALFQNVLANFGFASAYSSSCFLRPRMPFDNSSVFCWMLGQWIFLNNVIFRPLYCNSASRENVRNQYGVLSTHTHYTMFENLAWEILTPVNLRNVLRINICYPGGTSEVKYVDGVVLEN